MDVQQERRKVQSELHSEVKATNDGSAQEMADIREPQQEGKKFRDDSPGTIFRAFLGTVLAGTILSVTSGPALGEVVYQTGFEQPTFVPGALVGQGGWSIFEGSGPFGSITATFPKGGAQSMQIDPVANDAGGVALTGFRYLPGGASPAFNGRGRVVSVKVDAALIGPSTGTADLISVNFQPWLRTEDFGGIDFPRSQMWLSSDGHVHFESGKFVVGPTFLFGQYNELEARLDFPDQQTLYFLNGAEIGVDSWADLGATVTGFSSPELMLVELHASGDYNPVNYKGYFDNLRLSAVPEPNSLALLAIGILGIIGHGFRRWSVCVPVLTEATAASWAGEYFFGRVRACAARGCRHRSLLPSKPLGAAVRGVHHSQPNG